MCSVRLVRSRQWLNGILKRKGVIAHLRGTRGFNDAKTTLKVYVFLCGSNTSSINQRHMLPWKLVPKSC